ncbi:MAG: ABC transporter ATP-binding protein/permease [Candidatus Bipolaricaulota bacterium]|nr:ABC transporter ATP-binding protein/permease [Candidatus Bipolaricaulota bacterium]
MIGPHSHAHWEEEQLGKAFDLRLLRRLLRYARPYWKLFALALLLSGGIAVIELALPYLTKVAVDEVLVLPWVEVRSEAPPVPQALPLGEGRYLVREKDLPEGVRAELEHRGALGGRWLLLPAEAPEAEVARRYPDLFQSTPAGYALPEEGLKALPRAEVAALRAPQYRLLGLLALVFLAFLLVRFGLTYGQVYALQYAGQRIMFDMRREIFGHLLRLPMRVLDREPVGRLVTRATNDVAAIHEMYTRALVNLLQDFLMMLGVLAIMFRLNARLTLFLLAFAPVIALLAYWFRAKARAAYREARKILAQLNAYLAESLSGIAVIQLFRQELRSLRRFQEINRDFFRAQMRTIMAFGLFQPAVAILQSLALAFLIWYGGRGVLAGALTLGGLVAFLSYLRILFQPLVRFSEEYNVLQAAMAAAERIFMFLDLPKEPSGRKPVPELRGEIEFRDVWFAYNEGDWVLKGVSFRIRPGEKVAIVGPTGSGKTTIISLILGFYRPQKGQILIDGVPLEELDLAAYRRHVALVPQDVFLFSGNVWDNIRMWNGGLGKEEAERAAQLVGVHDYILRLPEGYETDVKERGMRISVGERQLLSLARAAAADPKLVILDEATANVDSHTEALVQQALERIMAGRTTLAIAHRLSTIRNADRVLVIHEGKLVEEGTVDELLAKRGLFWALWHLQFAGSLDQR